MSYWPRSRVSRVVCAAIVRSSDASRVWAVASVPSSTASLARWASTPDCRSRTCCATSLSWLVRTPAWRCCSASFSRRPPMRVSTRALSVPGSPSEAPDDRAVVLVGDPLRPVVGLELLQRRERTVALLLRLQQAALGRIELVEGVRGGGRLAEKRQRDCDDDGDRERRREQDPRH